jgi:HEAT repeat protein
MAAEDKPPLQSFSDAEIRQLVEGLESLQEGELGVSILAACGERAIAPLREFLLFGRPRGISQPRRRAVHALAELGAKEVLLEYLEQPRTIPDPVVRMAEEEVENTAARALERWPSEDVFRRLLSVLNERLLPGVIDTLGSYCRLEPVARLIEAMGDDICRASAEEALYKLGAAARPALLAAARTPDPSRWEETPSSLRRRVSALRILAGIGLAAEHWHKIEALLQDPSPEITARTALAALDIAPLDRRLDVLRRLVRVLPDVDWLLQLEVEQALSKQNWISRTLLQGEIERRQHELPVGRQALDPVLRLLRSVEKSAARREGIK